MSKNIPVADTFVIVDDEDYDWLSPFNWWLSNSGYAMSGKNGYMHRMIAATPKGLTTDHINRNKLDNQRSNLRITTYSENALNRRPRAKKISPAKATFCFLLDKSEVEALDAIAAAEGTSRSALLRRGVRRVIFLSTVPTTGIASEEREP